MNGSTRLNNDLADSAYDLPRFLSRDIRPAAEEAAVVVFLFDLQ
jgi:hypothetical protein